MAVERYIAVCWPLHHAQLCTVGRTYCLIALIWGVSFLPGLTNLVLLVLNWPASGSWFSVVTCYANGIFNIPQHQTSDLFMEVRHSTDIVLSFLLLADKQSSHEVRYWNKCFNNRS